MHHQQTDKNFNVVCPLIDFLTGRVAKPNATDIREMIRLGYIKPRSERAQKLVPQLRPTPSYTRVAAA